MAIIYAESMPENMYDFATDAVNDICEIKPVYAIMVMKDSNGNYYLRSKGANCRDKQEAANELMNQGLLELIAINRDYLDELEDSDGERFKSYGEEPD